MLRSLKEGTPEDSSIRRLMPVEQVEEFNQLVCLMNAANGDLAFVVDLIGQRVRLLELRALWLTTLQLWGLGALDVSACLVLHTKEPITASEYGRREEALRAELDLVMDRLAADPQSARLPLCTV